MDENLRTAAEAGDVEELYRLIQGNGNLLRIIDDYEFTDTPLHIAAEKGHIDFAMEIMNLKPSFAWKLNQEGFSPLHLTVMNRHEELVQHILEVNRDLLRVKGKNGKTPLHHLISAVENCDDLLIKFLEACPECIRDVTTRNQTALHIATTKNLSGVLKILTQELRKTEYCQEVVNRKDKDGNTALHIAALNNEPQILKLLLKCKADKHLTNQAGSTALEVAKQLDNNESISILHGCSITVVSTYYYKLQKQIRKHVTRASSIIFQDMDNISSDDRNALLVILGLLLTATYQASLSPPGSVWQGDSSSNSTSPESKEPGKSVMYPREFLFFYIATSAVFLVTFFLTLALLKPYPHGFRTALQVLLAFLAVCFEAAISVIAPTERTYIVIQIISGLVFILMMFMCIAHRVSRISVSILGCWFLSVDFFHSAEGAIVLICCLFVFLFLFLYDDFWKGAVLAIGYALYITDAAPWSVILLGCWFFLGVCRFCIRRLNFFHTRWGENMSGCC